MAAYYQPLDAAMYGATQPQQYTGGAGGGAAGWQSFGQWPYGVQQPAVSSLSSAFSTPSASAYSTPSAAGSYAYYSNSNVAPLGMVATVSHQAQDQLQQQQEQQLQQQQQQQLQHQQQQAQIAPEYTDLKDNKSDAGKASSLAPVPPGPNSAPVEWEAYYAALQAHDPTAYANYVNQYYSGQCQQTQPVAASASIVGGTATAAATSSSSQSFYNAIPGYQQQETAQAQPSYGHQFQVQSQASWPAASPQDNTWVNSTSYPSAVTSLAPSTAAAAAAILNAASQGSNALSGFASTQSSWYQQPNSGGQAQMAWGQQQQGQVTVQQPDAAVSMSHSYSPSPSPSSSAPATGSNQEAIGSQGGARFQILNNPRLPHSGANKGATYASVVSGKRANSLGFSAGATPAYVSVGSTSSSASALVSGKDGSRFGQSAGVSAAAQAAGNALAGLGGSSASGAGVGTLSDAWPPSLRAYVQRAFFMPPDDEARKILQANLKVKLESVKLDGTLWTRNWDEEPLPSFSAPSTQENNSSAKLSPAAAVVSAEGPLNGSRQSRWGRENGSASAQTDTQSGVPKPLQGAFDNSYGSKRKRSRFDNDTDDNKTSLQRKPQQNTSGFGGRQYQDRRSRRGGFGRGGPGGSSGLSLSARWSLGGKVGAGAGISSSVEDSSIDWENLTIKGTCMKIEKSYFRLTSAPDPSSVRPPEVLKKAIEMVRTSDRNYFYTCDQMKSIRQDLTVQRIWSELTVEAYELHARLALKNGDMAEYNQCQTQLILLYADRLKGCVAEFSAYRLLYIVVHDGRSLELMAAMRTLTTELRAHPAVNHALQVRAAVAANNYHAFFRLYAGAPNLGAYLMDICIEKVRFDAMQCMIRSHRPLVNISFLASTLGFYIIEGKARDEKPDPEEVAGLCTDWMRQHGAVVVSGADGEAVDSKASMGQLFIPEPEDAVAHGDATLAIDDFLKAL